MEKVMQDSTETSFDVVIIGGALSGAGTAILLLRERPELRVLIIEKAAVFNRKVGEATVEISTYFSHAFAGAFAASQRVAPEQTRSALLVRQRPGEDAGGLQRNWRALSFAHFVVSGGSRGFG